MELVVISPEEARADEIPVLERLVSAGLRRYHVRKPGWPVEQMRQWLETVPAELRARMVLHSHHELVGPYGLLGRHWRDGDAPASAPPGDGFTSCSCHRLEDLRARAGGYDAIFLSPVYASESKPGRPGWSADALRELAQFLKTEPRKARILALSGITPERVSEGTELGFDGIAVMGGVWVARARLTPSPSSGPNAVRGQARPEVALHPLRQYLQYRRALLSPILCLTQDGLPLSHAEQARQLCAAGAKFIQLRCKGLPDAEWISTARAVTAICHARGAICIINDRPDIAVQVGADGAHVGKLDGDWRAARRVVGPDKFLGGTVNDEADARRAVAAGVLDYVGIGPLRFTATKQKLAPVLGEDGIRRVSAALDGLPAWAIGGVLPADLAGLKAAGAAGAAVSSVLYRGAGIAAQFAALADAWSAPVPLLVS